MLLSYGLYPLRCKKQKSFESKAIAKKSFIPKGLFIIDMTKLEKLMPNKQRSSAKVLIEKLDMENNEWSISKEATFDIQDKAFAENGFRIVFCKAKSDDESLRGNTWVVKEYNASSIENLWKDGRNLWIAITKTPLFPILCRFLYDWVTVRCPSPNKQ